MGVGETPTTEVGHRVGLAPDDVVENPEPEILQRRADTENIVIAADDPERAVGSQDAVHLGEPGAAELVIGRQVVELVPIIVDPVDA